MALLLITLITGNMLLPAGRSITRNMLGHDFLAFYTAGTFARQGQYENLYNLDAAKTFQHQLATTENLQVGQSFGPFWNPPFYAWLFAPLSTLPYNAALTIWMAFNAVCLTISLFFLIRWLPDRTPAGVRIMVPLLVLVSMPCLQALNHAQNTCCSLLLVCLTINFWRQQPRPNQPFWSHPWLWSGLICGLLFYKPQLAAILAAVLILTRGRQSLAGVAITAAILMAIPLLTMPGITSSYLHLLPQNVHFMQVENTYLWERHVTLKAFWRLLLQGRAAGEPLLLTTALTAISGLLLSAGLGMLIWKWIRKPSLQNHLQLDRLIAATLITSPLLMPFYFDYDLLLLATPATLLAAECWRQNEPLTRTDRWFRIYWVIACVWMYFNSSIAGYLHINLSVPLLATLAIFSIHRAGRPRMQSESQNAPISLRPAA